MSSNPMMAALAMMGGGPPAGGLTSMLRIPCGPCITVRGADANQATTLVAGTLVCDGHAGAELARADRDSLNLSAIADAARRDDADYRAAVQQQAADDDR